MGMSNSVGRNNILKTRVVDQVKVKWYTNGFKLLKSHINNNNSTEQLKPFLLIMLQWHLSKCLLHLYNTPIMLMCYVGYGYGYSMVWEKKVIFPSWVCWI